MHHNPCHMKNTVFPFFVMNFLLAFSFGYAQDTIIKGGYKGCNVYEYEYKNGVLDISSKAKVALYTYDTTGHKIEEIRYGSDSSVSHKYSWKYDDKGNEIMFTWSYKYRTGYDGDDGMGVYWWTVSNNGEHKKPYDDAGNLVKMVAFDSARSEKQKHTWKYDKKGNKTEEVIDNSDNKYSSKTTYKYDKEDNLVEKVLWKDDDTYKKRLSINTMTKEINQKP